MTIQKLILGTRGSALAVAQSTWVAKQIEQQTGIEVELQIITTKGDTILDKPLAQIGGKGLFTAELEDALRSNVIDFAVHSLKDLPTENPAGLELACYPEREDARDALVGGRLVDGAVVGTGSLRRIAQIEEINPTVQCKGIRGNVDTRIAKMEKGDYDVVVLAMAGLQRLSIQRPDITPLSIEECIPAPAQGILGIQIASHRNDVRDILQCIAHAPTRLAAMTERNFLHSFGGGCHVCVGCYATVDADNRITAIAFAQAESGRLLRMQDSDYDPVVLGTKLAQTIRGQLSLG